MGSKTSNQSRLSLRERKRKRYFRGAKGDIHFPADGRSVIRRQRKGYVLLAVLAVLVLMITVLASLSKLSLRRALAAADAQVRLQQRIGMWSIESEVLPRMGTVFERLETEIVESGSGRKVPSQIRTAVSFGGVTYDVLLADEDAKLNLNRIYHIAGRQETQAKAQELLGPTLAATLRLAPATSPQGNDLLQSATRSSDQDSDDRDDTGSATSVPRAFRSWGEVFDLNALSVAVGDDAALPNATVDLTCWGSGTLNARRASDEAIHLTITCVLPKAAADRFLKRYREDPQTAIAVLIQSETKVEIQQAQLKQLLSESSTYFSMWIDASAQARRSTRRFSVMQRTEDGETVHERFAL